MGKRETPDPSGPGAFFLSLVEREFDPSLDPLLVFGGDSGTDEVGVNRPLNVVDRGIAGEFVRLDDVLCDLVNLVDVHTLMVVER